MTQEDKQLLLADLCARLPYNVLVHIYDIDVCDYDNYLCEDYLGKFRNNFIRIKPYLRSMSSMTEEEKEELRQEQIKDEQLFADCIKNHPEMRGLIIPHFAADWCDKNMFDYRGLISKGLALEAPKGMYN